MVNIKVDKDFKQLFPLVVGSLVYSPIKIYHNMLADKDLVLSELKGKAGIYLIHNLVNGKQYVGSSKNLRKRLLYYYSPASLLNNQYVSRSILKYGHDNFSLVILEFVEMNVKLKETLLSREQFYINSLKPILNILPTAGSSLGYKHSNETKQLLSNLRIGMKLSEETKQRLSKLFSGELNPFWSKTHNLDSLMRMKLSKIGELNPMFGKEKSPEFTEQMYKDKSGENNPMWGKIHSQETLGKMRKKVYVYNELSKEFLIEYESITTAKKDLNMGYDTLKKYLNSNQSFKGKIFNSTRLYKNDK